MKKLWVNADPFNKEVVISALESGAEAVVLPDGDSKKVRQLGKIKTVEALCKMVHEEASVEEAVKTLQN